MSNSPLVSDVILSPNTYGARQQPILGAAIHYMCWYCTAETCAESFVPVSRHASANYMVGKYGDIVLGVPEDEAAGTTSSEYCDQRCITIECANYMEDANGHVYGQLPDATWESLVALLADICRRNGKTRAVYNGSADFDTVRSDELILVKHKWFQSTDCPGPWLDLQFGRLADEVNAFLGDVKPEVEGWVTNIDECMDASDYAYCTCAVYSCGYSQYDRKNISVERLKNGTAETDCSAGVSWWLYKGGLLGENPWFYTAIEIDYLTEHGFALLKASDVTPKRNDVLWRSGHTALYIGDGMQAEALWSENRSIDGEPGDQTGGETLVREYPAGGWDYILRPPAREKEEDTEDEMVCVFRPNNDESQPLCYYDGVEVHPLESQAKYDAVNEMYQKLHGGKSIPTISLGEKTAPYGTEFIQVTQTKW